MWWLDALAAVALFCQLPIPMFWLIVHPQIRFWRGHVRAGYWIAVLFSWGAVAASLIKFHRQLLASERAPLWAIVTGLVLIGADLLLLHRVARDLGAARLVGLSEMKGAGELATSGLYARIRHPRYAGMMISMFGVCLIAATRWLWIVAAVWLVLALTAIRLEERELRARFGPAYLDYCRRVPRFLPLRLRSRPASDEPRATHRVS